MFSAGKEVDRAISVIDGQMCDPASFVAAAPSDLKTACDDFKAKVVEAADQFVEGSNSQKVFVNTIIKAVTQTGYDIQFAVKSDPSLNAGDGMQAALTGEDTSDWGLGAKPFLVDGKELDYQELVATVKKSSAGLKLGEPLMLGLGFRVPYKASLTLLTRVDADGPTLLGEGTLETSLQGKWFGKPGEEILTVNLLKLEIAGGRKAGKSIFAADQANPISLLSTSAPKDFGNASLAGTGIGAELALAEGALLLSVEAGIVDLLYGPGLLRDALDQAPAALAGINGFPRTGSGGGWGATFGITFLPKDTFISGLLTGGFGAKDSTLDYLALGGVDPMRTDVLAASGLGGGAALYLVGTFGNFKLQDQIDFSTATFSPTEGAPSTRVFNLNNEVGLSYLVTPEILLSLVYRLGLIESQEGFTQHAGALRFLWNKALAVDVSGGVKSGTLKIGEECTVPGLCLNDFQTLEADVNELLLGATVAYTLTIFGNAGKLTPSLEGYMNGPGSITGGGGFLKVKLAL